MYLIHGTTAFARITLEAFISKSILENGRNRKDIETKNTTGKNIATLNHLVYINYQNIKTAEKKNYNKDFFLLQRKIGFNVEEEG